MSDNKTSILIPEQLPEFIRGSEDYSNFILFLKSYYEWMEQNRGVIYDSKNILKYSDVDTTLTDFLEYFRNEFMSFFPKDALVDERRLIKIAKELYRSKGIPNSFKFLFRVLYNSDVNIFNTKDYILKASDGKWISTRSLKLATSDKKWKQCSGYKIFGEESKAYATIQNVVEDNFNIKIILSNILRNFESGEFVRVVDVHGENFSIDGVNPRARIVGLLSGVKIIRGGSSYDIGDPVVFYGGLDPDVEEPIGANGFISSVTSASIKGTTALYAGHGYRPGSFTEINLKTSSGVGSGARNIVTKFTNEPYYVYYVPKDTIGPKANIALGNTTFSWGANPIGNSEYGFANLVNANANTRLVEAFTFPVLKTFGISETTITSPGTGYDGSTIASAVGFYATDQEQRATLPSMGVLPPIVIVNGGFNYNLGDKIEFVGGSGFGAYATVTGVSTSSGTITNIDYSDDPEGERIYPLGGMGYERALPTLVVSSNTGSGAVLSLNGLVGNDAQFKVDGSPYGQVLTVELTEEGLNYVTAPNISLRIQDMLIENISFLPKKGDIVYQGTFENSNFAANVESLTLLTANNDPLLSRYNLRVYNYGGLFSSNSSINIRRSGSNISANIRLANTTTGIYTNGRKIYGNGMAQAEAIFNNGITLGTGLYSNQDGHPSGYSILQDSVYNEYTYMLQVEEALAKYKEKVLKFLHPAGLNYATYNILKNSNGYNILVESDKATIRKLGSLINNNNYFAQLDANSSNTIIFTNLNGANIANVVNVQSNSYFTAYIQSGYSFHSKITGVTANTITLKDEWVATVPNVAIASVTANSSSIYINSLTNAWPIVTGNNVTYLSDFMRTFDSVSFANTEFREIVGVDQPIEYNSEIIGPERIIIEGSYANTQTGLLTYRQNTRTSNVWISSFNT
jgi:hypothetical protein